MRLLFCDRHRLFIESLAHVVVSLGHEVLFSSSPEEAEEIVVATGVDICVMEADFGTARLVAAIRALHAHTPPTPVLILSGIGDPDVLAPLLAAGAADALSKNSDLNLLLATFRRVVGGGPRKPGARAARITPTQADRRNPFHLTRRERQVLDCLMRGRATAEVARDLTISYATARTHIQHVLDKLGAHSRLEAVAMNAGDRHRAVRSVQELNEAQWASRERSA
jgi:two-component system, NarL family, nitrate/nitrite response regulator NarL